MREFLGGFLSRQIFSFIYTIQYRSILWNRICLYKPISFLGSKPGCHNPRDHQEGERNGKKKELIIQENIFN